MHDVLIIDTLYSEALHLADLLSDSRLNCRVIDIASVGFIGGQRFLRRRPDVVFLDSNLCAMRIDEFLALAKQATHRYSIVMLVTGERDISDLPNFCFAIDRTNLTPDNIAAVIGRIDEYYRNVNNSKPTQTERELLESLLEEGSYSLKRVLAGQIGLPVPFQSVKPVLLQFRTQAEYFGVTEVLDKILHRGGRGRLIPLGGELAVVLLSGREILSSDEFAELLRPHVNTSWVMLEGEAATLYELPVQMKKLRALSRLMYFYLNGSCITFADLSSALPLQEKEIRAWSDRALRYCLRMQIEKVDGGIRELYLTMLAGSRSIDSLQVTRKYVTEVLRVLQGLTEDQNTTKIWPECRFECLEEECRHIEGEFRRAMEKLDVSFSRCSPIVQGAVRYIFENIDQPISLQDAAVCIGVSKEYLCTAFHREMKTGIVEFINRTKILLSCYFLATGRKARETAGQLGYSDNGYFERVFKKFMGTTPAQYLRQRAEYEAPYAALGIAEEKR